MVSIELKNMELENVTVSVLGGGPGSWHPGEGMNNISELPKPSWESTCRDGASLISQQQGLRWYTCPPALTQTTFCSRVRPMNAPAPGSEGASRIP